MKPHLFYFNERSMSFVLKKAGFKHIEFRSYQHYGLINHLSWSLAGETSTATKIGGTGIDFPHRHLGNPHLDEIAPFLEKINKQYKKLLEDTGKTDTLLVIARK